MNDGPEIGRAIHRIPESKRFARSRTIGTKRSATLSWQRMRLTAVQRWPEFRGPGDRKLGPLARSSSDRSLR